MQYHIERTVEFPVDGDYRPVEFEAHDGRLYYPGTDIEFHPESTPGARVKRRWVTEWEYEQ